MGGEAVLATEAISLSGESQTCHSPAPFPRQANDFATATVDEDSPVVCGGRIGSEGPVTDCWIYDGFQEEWKELAEMTSAVYHVGSAQVDKDEFWLTGA